MTTTDTPPTTTPPPGAGQPRNPLHGLTLESILTALVEVYGWEALADRVPVRCFALNPSIRSSLTFLRKTPWAREKVEGLYLFMLREQKRGVLPYASNATAGAGKSNPKPERQPKQPLPRE
jgi:uncharacterized protein (DUF2132 family)